MALEIKSNIKELSSVEREIAVAIPGSAVAKELDRAYRKLGQQVRLKGYRPGKVPRYILEQYYKADTEAKVLEQILGQSYRQALSEHKLVPVAEPQLEASPELISGMDYNYSARVEIKPTIDSLEYEGLEVGKPPLAVINDKAIDEEINRMREQQVSVAPVEDRDVIQQGDLAECNFSGKIDGEHVKGLGGVSFVIEVGANRFFPEAEQALVGKKVNEQFEVTVAVPEDHRVAAAQGKDAVLSIKPMEIKSRNLPDLNDEFAQDVSDDCKTVEELKEKIRQKMQDGATYEVEQAVRNNALDVLMETNQFELPNALIKGQAERMAMDQLSRLPQEQAEMIWESQHEKLIETATPRATRFVRSSLVLEKLVEVAGVEISDAELDEQLEKVAVQAGQSVKMVKQMYKKNRGLEELKNHLATEKALDLVVESAKIIEQEESAGSDENTGEDDA
jgi:trigger factor